MRILTKTTITIFSATLATSLCADERHSHGEVSAQTYNILGFSQTSGWLDPWPHRHFSPRNTPFVHSFATEPAFLDRDLFLDTRFARAKDEDELEIEAELEWALTRRIGMVFEIPYIRMDPVGGSVESGIEDIAVAPRLLIGETERFILSANFEVGIPTGSEPRDLGSGEVGIAPSLSAWVDLGNWFTLNTQFGTEHGIDSGSAEFFYNAVLGYSFLTRGEKVNLVTDHFPGGMMNLIVELTGRTQLSGDNRGQNSAELLFGTSYNFGPTWELRAGYQIPIGGSQEITDAFVLGAIYHF